MSPSAPPIIPTDLGLALSHGKLSIAATLTHPRTPQPPPLSTMASSSSSAPAAGKHAVPFSVSLSLDFSLKEEKP